MPDLTLNEVISQMKTTMQFEQLSVYQHGEMVKDRTNDLINGLKTGTLKYDWKLPQWIETHKQWLLDNLAPIEVINEYTLLHDIGKPYCLEYDDNGKKHFPNHAETSYQIYKQLFPDNHRVADLIRHDMDIHIMKSDGKEAFSKLKDAPTLILVGLAEIHANAEMFGGIESTSFKIKWKQIDRRGRQIIEIIQKQKLN